MHLSEFLDFESIKTAQPGGTKRSLLVQLANAAAQRLGLNAADIAASLTERESLGSTGFGQGVAIPHGKVEGLDKIYCLFARLAEPIDYKAIDGNPVDLVFLLLSPPDAGAEHLKALAQVSRRLRDRPFVAKLRGAGSTDALYALFAIAVDPGRPHAA